MRSAREWVEALENPHSKNAASAEASAETNVVEVAPSGLRLLSERKPKKNEAIIPGALNRVNRSVEEVVDSEAMECA